MMKPLSGHRSWRVALMVAGLLALSAPVLAGAGPRDRIIPPFQTLNTTAINASLENGTLAYTIVPTEKPLVLLHLELNETTPTGVRYMAFSPKIIEVAVSPIVPGILAIPAAAAAAAWFSFGRGRTGP